MATVVICCVKDAKLNEYSMPMVFPTIGVAERSFVTEIRSTNQESNLCKYPDDYALYAIGNVYLETGHIEPFDPPLLIVQGSVVKGS